jgi:hypothetical protein
MQPETMQLDVEAGYLRFTVVGEYTIARARGILDRVLDALGEHRADRALVDGRQLTGTPGTMERFEFGEYSAAAIAAFTRRHADALAPRIAYVLQGAMLDPGRLAETVAVNRGVDCRMFDEPDVALAWLRA